MNWFRSIVTLGAFMVGAATAIGAQGSVPPPITPRPFPGSAAPPQAPRPTPPQPPPATPPPAVIPQEPKPSEQALGGVPLYPTVDFLESFDAGRGQRYYLYGTNAAYADIVAYYRNVLKNGGRELYRTPPMQQFDIGRYQEDTMAYPPSVVVKDYTWNNSAGYLFVAGTTEKRFRTVIQIVPPSAPTR